ncbi:MAG TPA: hypothetical protein VGJ28_03245 [Micromonosporaceae bacterium]
MRIPPALTRLDKRVLPPIAKVLARLGRGARRPRILQALAVVISLTVVLVAVYAAGRQPARAIVSTGTTVRLGVADGGSIPQYVADSKARLAQLVNGSESERDQSYFALVSMSAYLTPDQLAATVTGLGLQITNVIMRVPSDYQTEIINVYAPDVPRDVQRAMQATAERKQRAVADDQTLEAGVTGSSLTDRTLRAQYRQEVTVARLEERGYRSLCACVYAVVVHANPAALAQLALRKNVRVVDPAPLSARSDAAVFLPPFPDQHRVVEPPPSSAPDPDAQAG